MIIMDLRIQQVNLNHARCAQDLLLQSMQFRTGVALISEPYGVPQNEDWASDMDRVATIYRNPRDYFGRMKNLEKR